MANNQTERTPQQARQAKRGRPVLVILLVSMALLVAGFLIVGLFQTPDDTSAGVGSTEQSAPASTN